MAAGDKDSFHRARFASLFDFAAGAHACATVAAAVPATAVGAEVQVALPAAIHSLVVRAEALLAFEAAGLAVLAAQVREIMSRLLPSLLHLLLPTFL